MMGRPGTIGRPHKHVLPEQIRRILAFPNGSNVADY
jgi:hypothetical protein